MSCNTVDITQYSTQYSTQYGSVQSKQIFFEEGKELDGQNHDGINRECAVSVGHVADRDGHGNDDGEHCGF